MFLKLTKLDDSKVLVNMDFVAAIFPSAIGRSHARIKLSQINDLRGFEADLEVLVVKETLDEILSLMPEVKSRES